MKGSILLLLALLLAGCGGGLSLADATLLEEIRGYYFSVPEDHPARYAANHAAGFGPHSSRRLRYGFEADGVSVDQARQELLKLRADIRYGFAWQEVDKKIVIPKVHDFELGGQLAAPQWSKALRLTGGYAVNTREPVVSGMEWFFCYGERNFYFALKTVDPEIVIGTPLPHAGDAVELFLCPTRKRKVYREIIVNPAGTLYNALQAGNRYGRFITLVPDGGEPSAIRVATSRWEDGYLIEIAVPWRELPEYGRGNSPQPGEVIHLMPVRLEKAGEAPPVHYTPLALLYGGHNLQGYLEAHLE